VVQLRFVLLRPSRPYSYNEPSRVIDSDYEHGAGQTEAARRTQFVISPPPGPARYPTATNACQPERKDLQYLVKSPVAQHFILRGRRHAAWVKLVANAAAFAGPCSMLCRNGSHISTRRPGSYSAGTHSAASRKNPPASPSSAASGTTVPPRFPGCCPQAVVLLPG
jgi:hypothetical protein